MRQNLSTVPGIHRTAPEDAVPREPPCRRQAPVPCWSGEDSD